MSRGISSSCAPQITFLTVVWHCSLHCICFLQLVEQVRDEGAEHQAFVAVVVAEEANSVDQGLLGKSCMMLGVDCLMVSVQEVI